jgi:hypothetical protein
MAKTDLNIAPAFAFPTKDFTVTNKENGEVSLIFFKIVTKMDYSPLDNFLRIRTDYGIVFAFDLNVNDIKEIV